MPKRWLRLFILVGLGRMLAPSFWADDQAGNEAFTLYLDGNAVDSELGVKLGVGFVRGSCFCDFVRAHREESRSQLFLAGT